MRILIFIIASLFQFQFIFAQQALNLVPYPAEVNQKAGQLPLKNTVSILFDSPESATLFNYLRDELKKQFQLTALKVSKGQKADLYFKKMKLPSPDKPFYRMTVNKSGISIESNRNEASFYAIQTFFQLIPPGPAGKRSIPYVEISDTPRFQYRGMHLDVGRHLFPVSFIKKYIDFLAYHKFNTFHWHLTEDQGWRIEIKKYPALTKTGAWRNGTIIGRYPGKGNDNRPYGGFYTQAQVREVVKYAKDRFIDVIPEIEMPGHSSAAIAAFPGLSCFPGKPTSIPPNMISNKSKEEQKNGRIKLVQETWGVFDDVFCAGNDSTFLFLQNVIDEVIGLFPSRYFHIGGDECPKTHWKICPRCQQRMKDNNLKDEHELQSWFVQRIEKYLNAKGRILIGWDEILEGGLAPNAVVMSWRGEKGGIEAAKQKHQVIMTPGDPVYFDHTQSRYEDSVTIGGYNPLDKVYAYEPVPKELNEEEGKFVLGAQANVWTEYMNNTRKVEYMIFPRMSALSEVLWTQKEQKNWERFEKSLPALFERYNKWKVNYSKAYFDLDATVMPTEDFNGIKWQLETKLKDGKILHRPIASRNGGDTTRHIAYSGPVLIDKTGSYEAITVVPGSPDSYSLLQSFFINKATGKKISLSTPPSSKYPGDDAFTLVNGIQNVKGMSATKELLGFEGTDCEAVIDLGPGSLINEIIVHTLEQPTSWIYSPSAIDISGSTDGQVFSPFDTKVSISKSPDKDRVTVKFASGVSTRYLKIRVMNYGVIPSGNPGAGKRAWLMVDEIEVN